MFVRTDPALLFCIPIVLAPLRFELAPSFSSLLLRFVFMWRSVLSSYGRKRSGRRRRGRVGNAGFYSVI